MVSLESNIGANSREKKAFKSRWAQWLGHSFERLDNKFVGCSILKE
jgi:hypothetical protein